MNILAKRIPSILGLLVLIAGLAGGAVLVQRRQAAQPRAAAGGEPLDLAISNVSDRSFTVSWTTAEAATGRLLTGETAGQLTRWVEDIRDGQGSMTESTTHYVAINNLKSGIKYQFLVESAGARYDSRGKLFEATTATELTESAPAADLSQGIVKTGGGPAGGTIVYAQLPGGQLLAAMTTDLGNWVIPLSISRISDLSGWLSYDRTATVYMIRADGGADGKATAVVTTGIDQPVPPIVLGQSYDFRQGGQEKEEGRRKKEEGRSEPTIMPESNLRSLFNFEDLGPVTPVGDDVTLLNPAEEGERLSTFKPELFGEGPKGTEINIKVESPEAITGNALVEDDGKWKFAMPTDLAPGKHTVTLTWTDADGVLQTLKRSFTVQAASNEPAFTASPSAVPTKKLTPAPTLSAKKVVTATTSGTPKSGGLTPSVMLAMMGVLLIISGGYLIRSLPAKPGNSWHNKKDLWTIRRR